MRFKIRMLTMVAIHLTAWVAISSAPQAADRTPTTQILKTGQTQCWDMQGKIRSCDQTGEDGEFRKGISLTEPRFTINTDKSVTDNMTRLIWAPNANLMVERNPEFDTDLIVNNGRVTWQHALDYVALLNHEAYLGYNDWRLPNINELESLRDRRYYNPCIPNTNGSAKCLSKDDPFRNVIPDDYWSSTSYVPDTTLAWAVDMLGGYVYFGRKRSNFYYVWPVRGGQ